MSRLAARARRDHGFVAAELVIGVGLLVLPVALLVLTLPGWSERQVSSRAIAREVARTLAGERWCDVAGGRALVASMAANLGMPPADVELATDCVPGAALVPGGEVVARVTVRMPAVLLPGIGAVGAWTWTAVHREPVDPFGAAP